MATLYADCPHSPRSRRAGEPTHAIVVDRTLWFIADVGWDRFEESGRPEAGASASRAGLRVIPLGSDRP